MSELTSCNYCTMQSIKQRAKRNNKSIVIQPCKGGLGGVNIYLIEKDEELTPDSKITAWFMELPDHCCC